MTPQAVQVAHYELIVAVAQMKPDNEADLRRVALRAIAYVSAWQMNNREQVLEGSDVGALPDTGASGRSRAKRGNGAAP